MSVSIGQFIGAVNLLELLQEKGPSDSELISELISVRISPTHGAHIDAALMFCEAQELISEGASGLELSAKGKSLLRKADGSSIKLARELLFILVTEDFPELISLAFQNAKVRSENLDNAMKEIFNECLLMEFHLDAAAAAWWNRLAEMGTYSESGQKAALGRASEERTLEFEKARLASEGFLHSERVVSWVSQDNDFAGFDILSRNGALYSHRDRNEPLSIEVKTGRIEDHLSFSFVISSREVEIASATENPWVLHVWFLQALPGMDINRPLILQADQVREACPMDSAASKWETARLFFDFRDLSAN